MYSPLLFSTATSQVFRYHPWKSSFAHYVCFCFIRARLASLILFAHGFIAAVFVRGPSFQVLMILFCIRTPLLNIFIGVMYVVAEDYSWLITFPQVVCFPVGAVQDFGTPIVPSSQ